MDIVVTFVTKVGEYLVPSVGRNFGYLWYYKKNVKDFQNQVAKLGNTRDKVQQLVDIAKRDGEEIKTDVQKWLAEVDEIIKASEELNNKIKMNKRCLSGRCPDLTSRFKLSKEATKKMAVLREMQSNGQIENVSFPAPPPSVELISNNDFVSVESSKSVMDQIMDMLKDDRCGIFGVYGMGGIGKTTLVKEVGKKAKKTGLFDLVVMAVVSQTPNLRKIQGQIADMLGLKLSEESEMGRAGRLYTRLKNEKRILIILDDVWARIDLTTIGIPHGSDHMGCKIIVTTRRENVCSDMGAKRIPLSVLSREESWDLFRESAGAIINSSTFNSVAMKVARECRGLPLALVTVGNALRDKEPFEWEAALQLLKRSLPLGMDETEQGVFSCIKLSYNYIKSDEIKSCFLLCSLFPEDHDIKIEDLARFAIGKGLFRDVDTMEEARSQAHAIVKHLKASCLLLDSDKEGCVKMHDVVRDFAISIASRGDPMYLIRAGIGMKEWPKKETFEQYTGISMITSDIHNLPSRINCPKLQILLLGENEGFDNIPDSFFLGMPGLRVLDLSERIGVRSLLPGIAYRPSVSLPSRILTLPPSFVILAHLRTLRLDHCKLGNVSTIGELTNLEILSFYGSDIRRLPEELAELINLRLLDLSFCQYLQTIPANLISKLSQLEELYMGGSFRRWEIEGTQDEEKHNASLYELKSLPRLAVLCVELEDMAAFPSDPLLFRDLHKFEISIGCYSIESYPNSKSLHLREMKTPLSDGVKAVLKTAENATLFCLTENSINAVLDIDGFGRDGLRFLKVKACNNMLSLIGGSNKENNPHPPPAIFTALEELHIQLMEIMSLINFPLDSASLQKLRVLKVEFCHEMFFIVPIYLNCRLQNLEEISVCWCKKAMSIFHLPKVINNEHMLLSSLRKLTLAGLGDLFHIWRNASSRLLTLHNLRVVEISSCHNLRYIFPYAIAHTLSNLEILDIKWCRNLTSIVAEAGEGGSSDHGQPAGFTKIKVVRLDGCQNLTSLFPGATDEDFMLPELISLELTNLPRLGRLCAENFGLGMPLLEELVMEKCQMMENFAVDPTAYGVGFAPKLLKLQVNGQALDIEAFQDLLGKKMTKNP